MPSNPNPIPQDPISNQNPRILMALNFLQAHLAPQPGLRDQPQSYTMNHNPNFLMQPDMQGHYSYPGNNYYDHSQGSYGSSPNKFRQNSGNKDDRDDKRDRNERDRSDNRGDRRGYNGNNHHDSDRNKRMNTYSRDKKPMRRSRSRSRSLERRNNGQKKGEHKSTNYNNRDRDGGNERRHLDREGSYKPKDNQYQRGNDRYFVINFDF